MLASPEIDRLNLLEERDGGNAAQFLGSCVECVDVIREALTTESHADTQEATADAFVSANAICQLGYVRAPDEPRAATVET